MTEEQKFRLAAKACGKDLTGWKWCDNDQRFEFDDDFIAFQSWNPRDDDGDSRRLQIDSGIDIHLGGGIVEAMDSWPSRWIENGERPHSVNFFGLPEDGYKATRLAVLECAAAIGEKME